MKITFLQVAQIHDALSRTALPKEATFLTTLRWGRNQQQVKIAMEERESQRVLLMAKHSGEPNKKPDEKGLTLSPMELKGFQPEMQLLNAKEVEVDIHPIEYLDSGAKHKPTDPDRFLDRQWFPISTDFLAALLDTVLVEHKNGTAETGPQ